MRIHKENVKLPDYIRIHGIKLYLRLKEEQPCN